MQNLIKLLASLIGFTPTGGISASNVQDAIAEIDTETVKLTGNQTISGTKTFSDIVTTTPKVSAYRSTDTTYASGVAITNTSTRVIYNTERKDNQNIYNAATGVITIPSSGDGDYTLSASVDVNFSGSSATALVYIVVMLRPVATGTTSIYAILDRAVLTAVTGATLTAGNSVDIVNLVAGDQVDVRIFVSYSGGTITLESQNLPSLSFRKLP